MGRASTRRASAIATLSAGPALGLAAAAALGFGTHERPATPKAHGARVLTVRDEGRLRFIHASGSIVIDEGSASGTFPGWVKVHFLYNGEPNVSASFTISGPGGSVSARGAGRLSSPTNPAPSFRGQMKVTGGTGRYAHIHGGGELFGVYYRRTYNLTVQAVGRLPY